MVAIPKPAATVILIDESYNVYLTKRPSTMKFLGGYFVFPGGTVDKEDQFVLDPYVHIGNQSEEFNVSYKMAAARELFEEVGILLNNSNHNEIDFKHKTSLEYRRALVQREITFMELLQKEDLQIDLSKLTYMGHFITPETSPYRYDTRFFIATLPKGQSPQPDEHEIEEAFWMTPEEALSAYHNQKIKMVPPTIISLQTIQQYTKGEGPLFIPPRKR